MKQLVELIEIEKSFILRKKALQKNYNLQTQEYISQTKETMDSLNKDILNKNQIVSERLSAYENVKDDSRKEVKLNPQKIKELILSQL
jgi:protein subunit release factor B